MKTKATVVEITEHEIAIVCVQRRAACDGCHKAADPNGCSVCTLLGGNRATRARARNTVGATIGDTVEVETHTRRVLLYAMLVFLMPVILALLGYAGGMWLHLGEALSLCLSACVLALAFVGVGIYSKLVVSRRLDVEIVSVLEHKGD